ncbi:bifunctional YncE family protein/alkaline phosphatase family protein [bacterium]|nr:bifunctional YncE family protein/alkaline phosphatase family protein [bacterium]
MAVLPLAACGGDDDDDSSSSSTDDDTADDDTTDDDTGDDDDDTASTTTTTVGTTTSTTTTTLGRPCTTYADCDDPQICKANFCADPIFPVLNEDIAFRRPTNDSTTENMLVNGRLIRPPVESTLLGTFPTRSALHPGGEILVVNENGFGTVTDPEDWRDKDHYLRVVDTATMDVVQELRMPNESMYIGMVFNGAGDRLYVSGGKDQKIWVYDVDPAKATDPLTQLESIAVPECYTTDLALDEANDALYVSCDLQEAVYRYDLDGKSLTGPWKANVRPYTIALSDDGSRLYVANWASAGLLQGRPKNGGDTVTVINTSNGKTVEEIVVGLSPEGMVFSPNGKRLYVACNKSDDIFVINTNNNTIVDQISMHGDTGALKGMSPTMMALSPDGDTLYVAAAGENFIGVIDLVDGEMDGMIPTEWYPTDVELSADGNTLYVLSGKGRGDGPTEYEGEGPIGENRDQVGRQLFGSVFKMAVPNATDLADYTEEVIENNTRQSLYFDLSGGNDTALPSPGDDRESPIKYVFFILKENFSYDCAYGSFEKGDGDPDFNIWTEDMIPNQRELARDFVLFDNFYADSESSIDGHQWAAAGIEPDFVEKGWVLDYAGYGMPTIAVSLTPGSIPESQFFMPHLIDAGLDVRAYGGWENFGTQTLTKYASYIRFDYNFNLSQETRDRDRGYIFVDEFSQFIDEGKVPPFSWVFLPNNHAFGYSVGNYTPAHWVADNDEGVGLVVDAIANSPIWGESIIFILEDDAQHGFDHVDKHRSPVMVVSPWVKRGYVSSVAYSMPNIHKTIEAILGVDPMHRFDNLATPMYDIFAARPNMEPYEFIDRIWPEEIYMGDENELTRASAKMDWDDIDRNADAGALYWRIYKGTEPPADNFHDAK